MNKGKREGRSAGQVLALLLGDALECLKIRDVDLTLPQLHNPLVLELPKARVTATRLAPIMEPNSSWV